jgi:carbon starvation protein
MNSLIILLVAVVWIVLGYHWYGRRKIQHKLMAPLDKAPTPANTRRDGMDYSPAPMLVLFGHHFSSIAGAGPIVGPIIAVAAFGWGPSVLWLLLGGLFIGAVHDYLSLMISVRSGGSSIPDTADQYVSGRARLLFLVFVWLALILVIAVFAAFAAQIMVSKPEIVIPTFFLIPLAILFGLLLKRGSLPLSVNTVIAIAGLVLLIWLGYLFPISFSIKGPILLLGIKLSAAQLVTSIWFILLMIYAVAASITPVWILLQPRDYISSWVLIIGVLLGLIGVVVTHPTMQAPFMTSFINTKQGPMFPFLFIIIACGAVSGFHSIVAGGTTSKQLKKEKHALPVSYGAMLAETLIGIISVIIAGGAIAWVGTKGLHGLLDSGSPLGVYGAGFGKLTAFIFGDKIGALIGVTIINIFIMTTLDTSVRLTRFLTGEMMGKRLPRLRKNKLWVTLIPVIPAFLLGISGKWKTIWPVFGSANQLVAALVLIIITAYLYSKGKAVRYTIWATVFMLITTVTALALLAKKFLLSSSPNPVLGLLSIILIVLAILMVAEGIKFIKAKNKKNESTISEV